jgi:hypothetical protein
LMNLDSGSFPVYTPSMVLPVGVNTWQGQVIADAPELQATCCKPTRHVCLCPPPPVTPGTSWACCRTDPQSRTAGGLAASTCGTQTTSGERQGSMPTEASRQAEYPNQCQSAGACVFADLPGL